MASQMCFNFSKIPEKPISNPILLTIDLTQDIHLRLPTLPPPPGSKTPTYHLTLATSPLAPPLPLPQLTSVLTHINDSLDVIDVSTYTGNPHDAHFISGQLKLLQENLSEARQALKGDSDEVEMDGRRWFDGGSADKECFDPPLPDHLSFHLSIHDASLILQLRTLEPVDPNGNSGSTASPTDALSSLTGGISSLFYRGPKLPTHDEVDQTFQFRGEEVRVKEKVRVESASDPSLMAVMAKVGALEHGVRHLSRALGTVMGVEGDESED
jgi:hypothetical protein